MMDAKLAALGLGWITSTIGIVFWVLVIGLLFVIVRFIRRKDYLLASVTCVPLAALFVLPVMSYMEQREYLAKYEPAKAIFDKLCKEQSAPIIKRTVEDVEGVLLLKVRPSARANYHTLIADPMWPGAAFEHERADDSGYAEYFLLDRLWRLGDKSEAPGMRRSIGKDVIHGFRYVDLLQTDGKSRIRMTGKEDKDFRELPMPGIRFFREETKAIPPRYAITFEDNVDPELRKHWIAGTTVLVLDMTTGEVVAQHSFWKWDQGFGNTSGARSPWGTATNCPRNAVGRVRTHEFVDLVLKAKQRN